MHAMAIGAHAFDAEVMSGGLLAKLTSHGHCATLVHMTLGERGDPSKKPETYARQLEKELQEAAHILGSQARWMGYPAGQVPISDEVALSLCAAIRELKPDLVITHWRGSWHPRHVATHYNVVRAARLAADESVKCGHPAHRVRELYFGENCEDLDGFRPSIYFDIRQVYDLWLDALACYELFCRSVGRHGGSRDASLGIPYSSYYRSMARVRGLESGFVYAQAFMPAKRAVGGLPEFTGDSYTFEATSLILK